MLLLIFGLFSGYAYWANNTIEVTYLTIIDQDIPEAFDGYKFVHISDLHSKAFGDHQNELINKISKQQPAIVVMTGDLIDRRFYQPAPALELMKQLSQQYAVYYVPGNHEAWSGRYAQLKADLNALQINILDNQSVILTKGEDTIRLIGIQDPGFTDDYLDASQLLALEQPDDQSSLFTMLLAHRPELISTYAQYPIDLVLSGHAHGGQIRLPLLGGLFAPDQGLLPQYTAGIYQEGDTQLVVNRGLGNSIFPFRILNNPEIIVITLKKS